MKKSMTREEQAPVPAVSDADFLAELNGAAPTPKTEAPKSKASKKPVIMVEGDMVRHLEVVCAGRGVANFVKGIIEKSEELLKSFGFQELRKKFVAAGCKIDNPRLVGGNGQAVLQFKGPYKVNITGTPEAAFTAAGLNQDVVDAAKACMKVHSETTIAPIQELAANPETKPLFDKVKAFIMTLSPDEKDRLLVTVSVVDQSEDLVPKMIQAISTFALTKEQQAAVKAKKVTEQDIRLEAFDKVFGGLTPLVKPTLALSSTEYVGIGGGMEGSLEFLKIQAKAKAAEDANKTRKITTTTKVEEVATAVA